MYLQTSRLHYTLRCSDCLFQKAISFNKNFYNQARRQDLLIHNRNLNNPVELILKNIISLFDIFKRESVGYERCGVNLALSDKRKHLVAVAAVNIARFEDKILFKNITKARICKVVITLSLRY